MANIINGTPDNDTLGDTSADDSISGLGGDDSIAAADGNDSLMGNDGEDVLAGGAGNDLVDGGTGSDTAVFSGWRWMYQLGVDAGGNLTVSDTIGGDGTDTLSGVETLSFQGETLAVQVLGADNDTVSGDIVFGGEGNDSLGYGSPWSPVVLDGGAGNDTLQGSYYNGTDILIGGAGDDSIQVSDDDVAHGGDGDDTLSLSLSYSSATLTGGAGQDRYHYNNASGSAAGLALDGVKIITDFVAGDGGDVVDLASLLSWMEGYEGEGFASASVRLVQDGADVVLEADPDASGARPWEAVIRFKDVSLAAFTAHNFGGYDPLTPAAGEQRTGTDGPDIMYGGLGNDSFEGGDGSDYLIGNEGRDSLVGGNGDDTIEGGMGSDTILAGAGNDHVFESYGRSVIDGGDGDDYLGAGGTAMTVTGGDGNDTILASGALGVDVDGGAGDDVIDILAIPGTIALGDGQDIANARHYAMMSGATVITDFAVGEGGDTLHIENPAAYFTNYSGGDPVASGHYAWVQDGADAVLIRDYDGAVGDAGPVVQVVRLKDVAATDLTWFNVSSFVGATAAADNLIGLSWGDSLAAQDGNDWVRGLGGDDSIDGDGGNDTLDGGIDKDLLTGGAGDDELVGGAGNDTLDGGDGTDTAVFGGARADYSLGLDGFGNLIVTDIAGRGGIDVLAGIDAIRFADQTLTRQELTAGPDHVTGQWLSGAEGDDWLDSEIGQFAILQGGDGNDNLTLRQASGILVGGAGDDALSLALSDAPATLSGGSGMDTYKLYYATTDRGAGPVVNGEKVILDFAAGDGGDVLDIEFLAHVLAGYSGDGFASESLRLRQEGADVVVQVDPDSWLGAGTWETVYRLKNVNQYELTAHNFGGYNPSGAPATPNVLAGGEGPDFNFGSIGHDTLSGNGGDDLLFGRDGRDSIDGGAGNDRLQGDAGNDIVRGGAGNDDINDYSGFDTLDGGAGDDLIQALNDFAAISGGTGSDTIDAGMDVNGNVDAGAGDDLVRLDPVAATVTLGEGRDVAALSGWMRDGTEIVITDFEAGAGGDILSIPHLDNYLSNYGGGDPFASGHFRWVQDGADAVLETDKDGPSGGSVFDRILVLKNVDAAQLTARNVATVAATGGDDALVGADFTGDTLGGEDGDDWISGFGGDDSLSGGAGDDTITGGRGNDAIDGGDGNDFAIFSGNRADYIVETIGGSATVTGANGMDVLSGVETLVFDDGIVTSNAAPVLTGDLAATVAFGGQYVLTAADIGFNDADNTEVVFNVSNVKGGGVFIDGQQAWAFSSTQLAAGSVNFRHGGYTADAAGFDVTVTDGISTSANASFAVTVDDSAGRVVSGFDAGEIELISKNAAGVQADDATSAYYGTPDGRYILFSSAADNLVGGTPDDGFLHVYRKDLKTGEVLRVDARNDGTVANNGAWASSISDDGNLVMFVTGATNFSPTGTNSPYLVYTKDMTTGAVSVVSTLPGGGLPDTGAYWGELSPDGGTAYYSAVSFNLGAGVPVDFSSMVYIKTLADGHVVRADDFNAYPNWTFYNASFMDVTRDGGKILFNSDAPNLVANDIGGPGDLFVLDSATGGITMVNTPQSGVPLGSDAAANGVLSADGNLVMFETLAAGLTAVDPNGVRQVYVKNMLTGAVTLISAGVSGGAGNGASQYSGFSADGSIAYFTSSATDLVAGDDNGKMDLFAYDLTTGDVTRLAAGNGDNYGAIAINADLLAFGSESSDLVAGDSNGAYDAFLMHVTGNDSLAGGMGNDTINAKGGDDTLTGGGGDDALDGGNGDDTAVFLGNRADYSVTVSGENATVTGADGSDTLTHVEWLRFADETVAIAPANAAPVLTGDLTATVAFGSQYVLTAVDIGFTDPDSDEVAFNVSNVKGGGVFVNGQQTDGFSSAELAAGLVTFRHGGYTADAAGFDVTVSDAISTSAKAAFAVTVDDSPGRVVTGHNAGEIELISKNAAGVQVNAVTGAYMGSADGRYVIFSGNATNLVFDGQNDGSQHVYRKDLVTGEVVRIDTAGDGELAESESWAIDVSADGNLVLFGSSSGNLNDDGVVTTRVYMKNVTTGEVTPLVDGVLPNGGTQAMGFNGGFADGAGKVVFSAWSYDVPGAIDFMELLYTRSLNDGTVEQLTDFNAPGNWTFYQATFVDVTPDGSKVLFSSNAPYLTANDYNGDYDMFVLDTATLAVSIVTAPASGVASGGIVYFNGHISADGATAVFSSTASSLTTTDTGGNAQVYIKNVATGVLTLISQNAAGEAGNGQSDGAVFSADGKTLYFSSFADNLVAGDDNGAADIFAYDLQSGGLTRVAAGDDDSEWAASLTPDRLLFNSHAGNLAGTDSNPGLDVFIKHITGNDSLKGGSGNDTMRGLGGNDTLDGGLGNDKLYGGAGSDTYYVDQAGDQVFENANEGTDTVVTSISLKAGANIEKLVLSGTANTSAYGNALANTLIGNSGNNTVTGYEGNDTLNGADGNDKLDGGIDHDVLWGGDGSDNLLGGEGSDSLDGGTGNDALNGGARWDTLRGGEGNDILDGGADNDIMYGGIGNDTYVVDHVGDRVYESYSEGTDTVKSSISFALTPDVEILYLTGTANTSGTGNGLSNSLYGNSGNNALTGGLGNDSLFGHDGNDSLVGGNDHDRLSGGNGNDTLIGGHGNDVVGGGAGADDFVFSATATNGHDHISDFQHGLDRLVFTGSDYGFAAGHVLTAAEFTVGTAAVGTNAQFVWNDATDRLYWDADGSGAGAAYELAIVTGNSVTKDDLLFT